MKKLLSLLALVLTICSTVQAQMPNINSPVGTKGVLKGREAIVVDLGGTIGKVAVATQNVGASDISSYGTRFIVEDVNDPSKNGLTDGWYVPSKEELEALYANLSFNGDGSGLEWKVTESSVLQFPGNGFVEGGVSGHSGVYVSATTDGEGQFYSFVFQMDEQHADYKNFGTTPAEWSNCAIRPFHKLPEPVSKIWYTSTDGKKVVPNSEAFDADILSNEYDDEKGMWCIAFDDELATLGYNAFVDCKNLASITIPSTVKTIGAGALARCTSLQSFIIPSSVTSIGKDAFYGSSSLTSVIIPSSVTTIGDNVFWACSSLTSITIPSNVTTIGDNVFRGCSSLTSVTIPSSVTTMGGGVFYDCTSLTSATINSAVTGISTFRNCSSLSSVAINSGVTTIGDNVFRQCSSLTSIKLPSSVTAIGEGTFQGCENLSSVEISENVTEIGENCFRNCTNLLAITLPSHLKTIGLDAFMDCKCLSSITIPEEVNLMFPQVFDGCDQLQRATFLGDAPTVDLSIHTVNKSPFSNSGNKVGGTILLVPDEYIENYKNEFFTNVFSTMSAPSDEFKSRMIELIDDAIGDMTLTENLRIEIETCKTNIRNATDVETIISEKEKATGVIVGQKLINAKTAAIAEIDAKVSEITDEAKATLQTTVDESKRCIIDATWIETVNNELALIKAKIDAIVNYYEIEQDLPLSQDEKEALIRRILTATSVSDAQKAISRTLLPLQKEAAKDYLISIWSNYPKEKLNSLLSGFGYLKRISLAMTKQEIDNIVKEAVEYLDSEPHMTIGGLRYFLQLKEDGYLGKTYTCSGEVQFTDGASYQIPSGTHIIRGTFNYSRTLPEGVWQCWYEPFTISVDNERFEVAEVAGILMNNQGEMVVCFRKLADGYLLQSNTIYVIRSKEGHSQLDFREYNLWDNERTLKFSSAYDDYEMGGYYGNGPLPFASDGKSWYTLNSKGQFSLRKPTDELKPQRFWLTVTPRRGADAHYDGGNHYAEAKANIGFMVIGEDEEPTGLIKTKADGIPTSVVYDMQGRKVTSLKSGQVYIMNGKKYLAK